MEALLAQLATWLISVAGGTAAVVLVAQGIGRHLLSRDIERYRAELQRTSAIEIERLKAALALERTEHETHFRWLHARRTEALERIYDAWVKASSAVSTAAAQAITVQDLYPGTRPHYMDVPFESAQAATEQLSEVLKGYQPHLANDVYRLLWNAAEELSGAAFQIMLYARITDPTMNISDDPNSAESQLARQTIQKIKLQLNRLGDADNTVVDTLRREFRPTETNGDREERSK